MKTVVVTVKTGESNIIEGFLEKMHGKFSVTVFEAPADLDYGYPFPVVAVSAADSLVERSFGDEAVCVLRNFAEGRHAAD